MGDWQDISTVPHGTRVLLWFISCCPENLSVHAAITGTILVDDPKIYWDGTGHRKLEWVSHWMPLPKPPKEPKQ